MKTAVTELRRWRENLPPEYRSMAAAGQLLGVVASTMLRYENGERRVPATKVRAISAITGIPAEILRPDIFGAPRFLKPIATENQTNG